LLNPEIVKKLTQVLGKENVFTNKEDLICYSYDSTPHIHLPDIVVAPANTEEIVAIIKLANEHSFPVIPRGGGTNLSGGTVPIQGGLVLALHRMNKIIEIDSDNLTATVEPGVITATFHQAVEQEGLFYPPDPQSMFMSTMGGNVAENAGGPRGVKYGVTKDYVLGIEVVTPVGEVAHFGGKTIKNVSGYDLIRLFAGSEGTLGIITQITFKLIPKPEDKRTLLAIFDHLDDAAKTVSGIIKQRIIPTTLELMDQKSMELMEGYLPSGLPTDAEGALLIEADGSSIDVNRQIQVIEQICKSCGAREVRVAKDSVQQAQLWAGRRSAFGAMARNAHQVLAEDATVPRSKVPDMVRSIQQIAAKYQLTIPILGHAGDGNMHPNILVMKQDEEEMKRVDAAIDEMFKAALDLGGTLSGEHGIGLSKQKYMKWQFDKASLDMMMAIKKAVDPKNILNPGKIFLKDE